MFQATRRRLAFWYTGVTAVLLLVFASGVYVYVRTTLVERVDDTLNHVIEVVQRSLVIESDRLSPDGTAAPPVRVNLDASFRTSADTVDDDHIDLEWFSPTGELLWTTLGKPLEVPLHLNPKGETVHLSPEQVVRQVTQRVQIGPTVLGYLRVSHPWFEVAVPSRKLILDLALGTLLMIGTVAGIGWFLSGLAMMPVRDSYNRLKQFTADASHELRNPIAVIQTNVQVALADPEPDPQFQHEQLQVIERITRRLGRLVEDLLFLARQDSGLVPPSTDLLSLGGLLADVVAEQQAIAQEQEVSLLLEHQLYPAKATTKTNNGVKANNNGSGKFSTKQSSPAPGAEPGALEQPPGAVTTAQDQGPSGQSSPLCLIKGDRDQLVRLFTNLVSNAVQYTPAGGEVRVRLEEPMPDPRPGGDSLVTVHVCDSGLGIAADELPHIFERFYRVDSARTAPQRSRPGKSGAVLSGTGSGLGLAIAKAIVDHHRGKIYVESELNRGTTFSVVFPAVYTAGNSDSASV